jgi:hypothetical protein
LGHSWRREEGEGERKKVAAAGVLRFARAGVVKTEERKKMIEGEKLTEK